MLTIILEGCDKTGKTYLAKQLKQVFGGKVVHNGPPVGDPYVTYCKQLDDPAQVLIFDRFLYGELVYGPLLRGRSQLTKEQQRNIELKALARNAVVIYCHGKPKELRRRFQEDEERLVPEAKVRQILVGYTKVLATSFLRGYEYDFTVDSDDELFSFLRWAKDEGDELRRFPGVIGNTVNPQLILVGDTPNPRQKYSEIRLPFDFGPSSTFLFEMLKKAKIPLYDVAILNSDNKCLKRFLRQCGVKPVALGQQATVRLQQAGCKEFHVVNHPQHESRFHHHDSKLAKQLKSIFDDVYEVQHIQWLVSSSHQAGEL